VVDLEVEFSRDVLLIKLQQFPSLRWSLGGPGAILQLLRALCVAWEISSFE